MKPIPLYEPWFDPSYADTVRDQVGSGWVGPGKTTSEFASRLSSYVGVKHCLLTTSGTVALMTAAWALGLRPGDEILVSAYGVVSTINAFAILGLKPRLVDIEQATGCMSPEALGDAIKPKTRAVCFVNFSGFTGQNLVSIAEICQKRNISLIEDAACAFGHRFKGRSAGTFGSIGTYSFSVPKIITTGQGGALVTQSTKYYKKALCFIDQGDPHWRRTNLIHGIGGNFRFNDILASFGLAQLKDINKRLSRKSAVYKVLHDGLRNKIFRVPGDVPPLHTIVFTPQPHALINYLKNQGIEAVRQYRTISQHPAYRHLAFQDYPNADFWTRHAVYLPFGLSLTVEDAERIVETVVRSNIPLLEFGQE